MTPDPTDNRATAERIAREVYAARNVPPHATEPRSLDVALVLAGMAHRDRAAEREAAKRALMAFVQHCIRPGVDLPLYRSAAHEAAHPLAAQFMADYLAAEFDAGERVTLSDGSVVTLSGCGNYLVVTSHSEPPRTWRVDQWRHVPHTGADFDAVKRLAEQRGAER